MSRTVPLVDMIVEEILHVDGNWQLMRESPKHVNEIYIKHVGKLDACKRLGPYRYSDIIDMVCDGCHEAAPEALRGLYHLVVWNK